MLPKGIFFTMASTPLEDRRYQRMSRRIAAAILPSRHATGSWRAAAV